MPEPRRLRIQSSAGTVARLDCTRQFRFHLLGIRWQIEVDQSTSQRCFSTLGRNLLSSTFGNAVLISARSFNWISTVPADDPLTSVSGLGSSARNGAVAFNTTHWSMVLRAQDESPAAYEALETLCRVYWRPIYSFVQRQGFGPEEAKDITQGFFAQLLERKSFNAVRKEKGRLRSYLLGALKYFLTDEHRRAMAIKRGKGQRLIPLEGLDADERIDLEPADPLTAEMIYERRWASTLLECVLSRLKEEYRAAGNAALFDSLKQLLPDEPGAPSQAEIAAHLGMTENAVRQAFYRFRQRYQSLLRDEIAHTVATPGDIEDELRHLIAVVAA
ncbi:MAG: sigma-70 family RNA polymerase sigma factor [Verrucomicrobiota bacterium]|nr:sigma-70 family RNA polymerase sigma factor [Verrucomicrobiota bacterium]